MSGWTETGGRTRRARRPNARADFARRRGRGWLLPLALAASTIGGCASAPPDETPAPVATDAERIVTGTLVDVLARALDPRETTVQVARDDDAPDTRMLVDALAARGFGIQRVAADQGAHFLDHAAEREPLADGDTRLQRSIALGPVEVRREYTLGRDGTLSTAGPIRLSGVRGPMEPEQGEYPGLVVADPAHRRIEQVAARELDMPAPIISLVTPELVDRVARESTRVPGGRRMGAARPSAQGLNANRVETGNLFYGGASNFGSTLDGRDRVDRRVVVFADDSLVLGPDNRRMVERFVDEIVMRDDLIGLVGCSNGPTALEIGNEGLALGRAARVVEELIALGIERERIYDEGCWAPVSAGERFPGRGVVIELWRNPA